MSATPFGDSGLLYLHVCVSTGSGTWFETLPSEEVLDRDPGGMVVWGAWKVLQPREGSPPLQGVWPEAVKSC